MGLVLMNEMGRTSVIPGWEAHFHRIMQHRVHSAQNADLAHSCGVLSQSPKCMCFAGGTEAIVIKPAEDSDTAQAPLAEWPDLAIYARGIVEKQAAIPADLLSLPHGLTPLPLEAPLRFVAEPYVATDK